MHLADREPGLQARLARIAERAQIPPSQVVERALYERYGWDASWGICPTWLQRGLVRESMPRGEPRSALTLSEPLWRMVKEEAKVRRVTAFYMLASITSAYLLRLEREYGILKEEADGARAE